MANTRNKLSTESLESRVWRNMAEMLAHGAHVTLALSGGLDSCVLLELALAYARTGACTLSALHIHHGLSTNADQWSAFCRELCQAKDVPLQILKVTVPRDTGDGLELSARRLRYAALAETAGQNVLLAHHADDQAETLLLNLLRGSGVRGAAAMLPVSGDGGRYVRPLLDVSRSELEAYAREHGLRWIEDESNTDSRFSRNYLRHQVMPLLQQRFPAAVANLGRAAGHFAEAQEMLDEMALHDLQGAHVTFPVAIELIHDLSAPRACNLLRFLLARAGLQAPVTARMKEALRQFLEAAPDRHPSLQVTGYRLLRRKRHIHLELD